MTQKINLKLFETTVLKEGQSQTGLFESQFEISTGSRLVFGLYITAIDPGASVNVKVLNTFSKAIPYENVLEWDANQVGRTNKVLTDIHNLFKYQINVTGGSASYFFGITVLDNALASRAQIDNAIIEVALSHLAGFDGVPDSVRIGNGIYELNINPDGSINISEIGVTEDERVKRRLMCAPDLDKAFTWAEIDGVRRVTEIVFTSSDLNADLGQTVVLTRSFTYQGSDPFDLINITDDLDIT